MRPGGVEHGLLQRAPTGTLLAGEAGSQHDGGLGAAMPEGVDQGGNRHGRGADDPEVRNLWKVRDVGVGADAGYLTVLGVDRPHRARKAP